MGRNRQVCDDERESWAGWDEDEERTPRFLILVVVRRAPALRDVVAAVVAVAQDWERRANPITWRKARILIMRGAQFLEIDENTPYWVSPQVFELR